jgi:hypothetical protein
VRGGHSEEFCRTCRIDAPIDLALGAAGGSGRRADQSPFAAWQQKQAYGNLDRQIGMFYTMSIDIQVLLGLILWFGERRFATITGAAAAAGQSLFFGIEHPVLMLLALGLAHVGYSRSRKGVGGNPHRTAALFYLGSLIIIAAIPWDRLAR